MIIFNFEYHFLFAILLFLAISHTVIQLEFIAVIGCLLSFYLPDIDQVNSKPGKKLFPLSWLCALICGHRGFTHSIIACLLVFVLASSLNLHFGYGVLIGYGSHLLSDSFTTRGIPLFWPLKIKIRIPILHKFTIFTKLALVLILMYFIMNDVTFK